MPCHSAVAIGKSDVSVALEFDRSTKAFGRLRGPATILAAEVGVLNQLPILLLVTKMESLVHQEAKVAIMPICFACRVVRGLLVFHIRHSLFSC